MRRAHGKRQVSPGGVARTSSRAQPHVARRRRDAAAALPKLRSAVLQSGAHDTDTGHRRCATARSALRRDTDPQTADKQATP
eukprot:scaffold2489_cov110-Isochrysis_galbana.AAC.10